ncbi:MAG: outer membrane protein assembly factor BamE [Wolbachia endosymbiont of Fragariocoptes setiger]|nr:outer membrane protein assembly factor BamE [Wolbachia endosymbiont of Fragariocoptes setiger]
MKSIVLSALLLLTSCGHTIYNHGIPIVTLELWSQVKIGDDKERVIHLLGSPTLISEFDENTWYYISYRIKQMNFFGNRKYNSKSVQISFDKGGKVIEIKEANISERSLARISDN